MMDKLKAYIEQAFAESAKAWRPAKWWFKLSPKEQKAYVKKYPNSKYAHHYRSGNKAPPSMDSIINKVIERKNKQPEKKKKAKRHPPEDNKMTRKVRDSEQQTKKAPADNDKTRKSEQEKPKQGVVPTYTPPTTPKIKPQVLIPKPGSDKSKKPGEPTPKDAKKPESKPEQRSKDAETIVLTDEQKQAVAEGLKRKLSQSTFKTAVAGVKALVTRQPLTSEHKAALLKTAINGVALLSAAGMGLLISPASVLAAQDFLRERRDHFFEWVEDKYAYDDDDVDQFADWVSKKEKKEKEAQLKKEERERKARDKAIEMQNKGKGKSGGNNDDTIAGGYLDNVVDYLDKNKEKWEKAKNQPGNAHPQKHQSHNSPSNV